MTEHYVTLFDTAYLLQGLALHRSMQRHLPAFRLWVLCMDDEAYRILNVLQLPSLSPLRLTDFETPELLAAKPTRSRAEYCWTVTPFSPRFVFEVDGSVQRVTYVDADVWFHRPPDAVFREFDASGKQVLITDHAYAPEHDQSTIAGQYCVQFVTFTREGGEPVRKWWEERCVEWCFARYEDGKFGDQKYLDAWPAMFADRVHVLADREAFLAPWNVSAIPYGRSVAFHFHGLKVYEGYRVFKHSGRYKVPRVVEQHIYDPYVEDLAECARGLGVHGFTLKLPPLSYPALLGGWLRRVAGDILSPRSVFVDLR
jgi:hypothetical protein